MTDYVVNKAVHPTLTANTADTITFAARRAATVQIVNRDPLTRLYFRADGKTAIVADIGTVLVEPGASAIVARLLRIDAVSVIASHAVGYTITVLD